MGMGGQRHFPAALPPGKTRYPLCSSIFQNSAEKIIVSLISDKKERVIYMKIYIHFLSYLAQFFLEVEMFLTEVVQKIKTHI